MLESCSNMKHTRFVIWGCSTQIHQHLCVKSGSTQQTNPLSNKAIIIQPQIKLNNKSVNKYHGGKKKHEVIQAFSAVGLLRVEPAWQKVWFKVQTAEKVWHHQVYKWKEKNTPPTALQPPKSCRHSGRALLQECCQLRYYYSTQSRLRGGEKKRLWERTRGERWIERQPNIYSRLTKARTVHMLVMELPWHIVKWGIMMTKHCPRIKECERRVKRSTQTELHAFLCSDLTEMQRRAGCPLCLKFEFICLR